MQHIGRVDVLEASQDLVEEVANVVSSQALGLEQLVQVCLHQCLYNVDILHLFVRGRPKDIMDVNDLQTTHSIDQT